MLVLPPGSIDSITLMGIDPGSTQLGLAILNIDLNTFGIINSEAWTLNGSKLSDSDSWVATLHGDRYNRIAALESNLIQTFNYYRPHAICSESPFINSRFPAAGVALTEVMCGIRRAVTVYDVWKELILVPPSSVKNAIGVKGNGDKVVMKEAVLNLSEIRYSGSLPMYLLDEHSIDALAVAYYLYRSMFNPN